MTDKQHDLWINKAADYEALENQEDPDDQGQSSYEKWADQMLMEGKWEDRYSFIDSYEGEK